MTEMLVNPHRRPGETISIPRKQYTRCQDIQELNKNQMLAIMEAMNEEELDDPKLINDDRRKMRICAGSGLPPPKLMKVIEEQRNWATMLKNTNSQTREFITTANRALCENERKCREHVSNVIKAMPPQMLKNIVEI
jgi:signal recognition particle GTPase